MINQAKNLLKILIIICLSIASIKTIRAQERIEIADLYKNNTFSTQSVYGITSMKDGLHYTNMNEKRMVITQYSYKTGEPVKEILA